MSKAKRAVLLELAYELIQRVHSDLARGTKSERELCQAPEFRELFKTLIILSEKMKKCPKSELLEKFVEEHEERMAALNDQSTTASI